MRFSKPIVQNFYHEDDRRMKTLVTGASGFLGTHLLKLLQNKNTEIHTLGTTPASIGIHHAIAFDDCSKIKNLLYQLNPDAIFHLAGVATAPDFRQFYEINVLFAANLIWALKEWGNKQCPVVLTGSSAEYGMIQENELPIKETTPPKPYDHYGISKLAQTLMGERESRDGWSFIMVRPFNIIGPGMPSHLVLQNFVEQLINIRLQLVPPILEVGALSPQRDFVNVGDVAESMWHVIHTPQAYGEIINICSGIGTSIDSLLRKLLEIADMKVEIRTNPDRLKHIDVPVHIGSNKKQKSLTGYSPTADVQTSIRQILEFEGF
jgi:GDP-4-dehydro-6-deoxy-D-mannose reductase